MSESVEFSIAEQFCAFPGGRDREDGPFSGEMFRDDFLRPLLEHHRTVILNLDGVAGLPSSFLEEVFGGLIRHHVLKMAEIGQRLELRTSNPELEIYIPMAYKCAQDVGKALAH